MMAPYPATTIANEFLRRARHSGRALTHMQVQKLVYLAHGWHLALADGDPLIKERVQAWRYGPVIEELYDEFAELQRGPIDRLYARFSTGEEGDCVVIEPSVPDDDDMVCEVIDGVWNGYGHYSGSQLSSLTHKSDTPWDRAKTHHKSVIRDEVICEHFRQLAKS